MTPPSARAKKQAYRFGRYAELICRWRLRLAGYRIVEKGYRAATGEIDIIARRGQLIAFIEVKARASSADAVHALGPKQRRRIERTALAYLASRPELAEIDSRFDLMALGSLGWPSHLRGVWILGE